jgi:hypothetical protein
VSDDADRHPGGRPTDYRPEYASLAEKLCRFGATDADLADEFGVSVRTIQRWTGRHEEFCRALRAGKDPADERVERSLYQRAVGYEMDACKILMHDGKPVIVPYVEQVGPDTTACIFWLKNRRRDKWTDTRREELSGPDGKPIEVSAVDEIARRIARLSERARDTGRDVGDE